MRLPVHGSSVCVCAWSLAEEDEETIKLFWKGKRRRRMKLATLISNYKRGGRGRKNGCGISGKASTVCGFSLVSKPFKRLTFTRHFNLAGIKFGLLLQVTIN